MKGFMVYAYDNQYPEVADRQVKGVFLDEEKAKSLVNKLKENGKHENVDWAEIDIIE